jgi:uncharacterized membrane protein YphA (DoxX/SURF4 family)
MNDFGLVILRAVAGGYVMKYGLPKLRDVDGSFTKDFESLGFRPARQYVKRAGLVELVSGALIVLGALGSVGPMMLPADMVVAGTATAVRAKRVDFDQHEEETLFAAIALLLARGGPGNSAVPLARNMNSHWLE